MFGKKKNKNWNVKIKVLLALVVLLVISSIVFAMLIPKRFEAYQANYVDNVISEVNEASNGEIVEEVIELRNEAKFDIIIFDKETVVYSSNKIYDIEQANTTYTEGYVYKGVHESNGYLIWLVVYNTEFSDFVNRVLIENTALVIIQTLLMLAILYIIANRSIKPLNKLSDIVIRLRKNSNAIEINEDLDEISAELVKVSNDLKLKLYYSKKEEKEFQRRYTKQSELLYEQKSYLANVVHDIKSTFAAIEFSSKFLKKTKDLTEQEKRALNSIENSSSSALKFITSSLNNVIDDKYSIYTEKTTVDIEEVISKYFEFNNMLLFEKNLELEITSDDVKININAIKFYQIMNNILSNMIKYSKEGSTLKININNDSCTFINKTTDKKYDYSNSFGLNSINELCDSIDITYDLKFTNNQAEAVLTYRGDKNA